MKKEPEHDAGFTENEKSIIQDTIRQFSPSTQISIVKIQNKNVFFCGMVKQDKEVELIHNHHAVFEIGSISKVFTSTILAQMATEGSLDIDDEIDSKMDFKLNRNVKITYRELSTHSSGLPPLPPGILWEVLFKNRENPYRDYSEKRLIQYMTKDLKLKNKGSFRYSNLGAGILGYVLSRIENISYEKLINQRIFRPFNMVNSTTNKKLTKSNLIIGLNKYGKPTSTWDLDALAGAGAVLSSTCDLSKFILEIFKENSDALKFQMKKYFEHKSHCLALGWHILNNKIEKIEQCYFHNGGTGGYSSSMILDMNKKNGIAILSNISGFHKRKGQKVDELAFNLMGSIANN